MSPGRRAAVALILLGRALADPVLPVIPPGNFKATAYGAVGDGSTDSTAALQAALNAAAAAGGGTVEIPAAAGAYLSGPLSVSGNTNLQVDAGATLQMLPYGAGANTPGTYPLGGSVYTNFISVGGDNVSLTGGGTIEGNGAAWWAAYAANSGIPHRPYLIKVTGSNFVLVRGLTLSNSPMEHLAFGTSSNVTIDHVTISAPAGSPNTDGIDPAGSHFLIQNCVISDGDDDIGIKPQNVFCSDIVIRNCAIGSGHGISVGGQTNDGLDGMTVSGCTFTGTQYGLRLKADPTEGGVVQNLSYSNLTMTNVQYPVIFYSYYDQVGTPGSVSGSNQTTAAKVKAWNATPPSAAYGGYATATLPAWQNITISNLTSTNLSGPSGYCIVWGLPNRPIANLTLDHVQISGATGFGFFNAQNVRLAGGTSLSGAQVVYNAQVLTALPQSQAAAYGSTVAFTVAAAATPAASGPVVPAFRWLLNGQPLADGPRPDGAAISGSSLGTLLVRGPQAAEAGVYSVAVTHALDGYAGGLAANGNPAVATAAATLALGPSGNAGRLSNVSARAAVGPGQAALVAGFVLGGAGTDGTGKRLLIRGVGPTLSLFNVPGPLADPSLQVYDSAAGLVLAANDNWGGNPDIAAAAAQVGAFALAGPGIPDAALLRTLLPGRYAAAVSDPGGKGGVGLAEVYDAEPSFVPTAPRLVNVSARAQVNAGAGSLIVGFVIGGSTARTVLVRGIGPALAAYGVPGTLSDPNLQVFNSVSGGAVAANDNWGGDPAVAAISAQVGAFALADPASLDSALVTTLPPGVYAAVLAGAGKSAGIALLEVYEVP